MKPYSFNDLMQWICLEYYNHKTIYGIKESDFFITTSLFYNGFNTSLVTLQAQNIITAFLSGANSFTVDLPNNMVLADDSCFFDEYVKAWILIHILSSLFRKNDNEIESPFFLLSFSSSLIKIINPSSNTLLSWFLDIRLYGKFKFYFDIVSYELNHGIFNKTFNIGPSDYDIILNSLKFKMADSIILPFTLPKIKEKYEELLIFAEKNKLNTYFLFNNSYLKREIVEQYIDEKVFKIDNRTKLTQFNFLNHLSPIKIKENEKVNLDKLSDKEIHEIVNYIQKICNERNHGIKLIIQISQTANDTYFSYESIYYILHMITISSIQEDLIICTDGNFKFDSILYLSGVRNFLFSEKLLSVGGYGRITQYSKFLNEKSESFSAIDIFFVKNLNSPHIFSFPENQFQFAENKKLQIPVTIPIFDCFIAPCKKVCPIDQDISEYIWHLENEKYEKALGVIHSSNPLPTVTSFLCEQPCKNACIRKTIDEAVKIKELKHIAMNHNIKKNKTMIAALKNNYRTETISKKIAIIGSGPTGLSCAYTCIKEGWEVSVFEKDENIGGSLFKYVPEFEMPKYALTTDLEILKEMGVKLISSFNVLNINEIFKLGFNFVFLSIGRQQTQKMVYSIPESIIIDAIDFITNKENSRLMLKNIKIKHVCVIGGSRTAIVAARIASRLKDVKQVFVINKNDVSTINTSTYYIETAMEEDIQFLHYFEPEIWEYNMLVCKRLNKSQKTFTNSEKLDESDFYTVPCDIVINASGMENDKNLLKESDIILMEDKNKNVYETSHPSVFVGGSFCNEQLSLIESIAEGIKAAKYIIYNAKEDKNSTVKGLFNFSSLPSPPFFKSNAEINTISRRKITQQNPVYPISPEEALRCSHCDKICGICADVCPNRANIKINNNNPALKNIFQIIHIARLCIVCNKCVDFCPYNGIPYNDKFIIYHEKEKFDKSNKSSLYTDKINSKIILRDYKEIKEYSLQAFRSYVKSILEKKRVLSNIEYLVMTLIDGYNYIF